MCQDQSVRPYHASLHRADCALRALQRVLFGCLMLYRPTERACHEQFIRLIPSSDIQDSTRRRKPRIVGTLASPVTTTDLGR